MRHLSPMLAALLALPTVASAQFEGVVTYQVTSHRERPTTITTSLKGTKARSEIVREGRSMTILSDRATGTQTTLIPERKMYMTLDLGAMRDRMAERRGTASDQPRPEGAITATGRRETVAGIPCEHYVGRDAARKSEMDLCIAKGMGTFTGFPTMAGGPPRAGAGDGPDAGRFLSQFKDGAFVLKLEGTVDGETVMRMEATKVERKALADDLFAPPPGWTAFTPPMMGGRRGRP